METTGNWAKKASTKMALSKNERLLYIKEAFVISKADMDDRSLGRVTVVTRLELLDGIIEREDGSVLSFRGDTYLFAEGWSCADVFELLTGDLVSYL
jgi:hypothetical protein